MENKPRLTKETMTQLPIGAVLPIKCNTAAELDNAYHNALHVRRKYPRRDGYAYKIQRSAKTMTVIVSVIASATEHEKV